MVIQERIKELIHFLDITPYQFAKTLGYERKNKIYNLVGGKNAPSWEMLSDIATHFPQVSMEWLVRGEGSLLKPDKSLMQVSYKNEIKAGESEEMARLAGRNLRLLTVTVDKMGNENIVMVPMKLQAGYRRHFMEPAFIEELNSFTLPNFTQGTFRAFEVEGDSMTPTIHHADIVIGSFVEDWRYIQPKHVYMVISRELGVVKRIEKAPREETRFLTLLSDNSYYPPMEIEVQDVVEIWQVRGILTCHIPANMQEMQKNVLETLDALYKDTAEGKNLMREIVQAIRERYLEA
jgi:repressor LexA